MGFLAGKRLLITGLLSNRSIAYGIAKACHREGAELAFSYVGERFKDRITEFAAEFGSDMVYDCDVSDDAQITGLFEQLGQRWDVFDGFVHSIGFAPREAIAGDFLEGFSREGFRVAHEISAYSFPAMAKAAASRLRPGAALLTLSYLGAMRSVPSYNYGYRGHGHGYNSYYAPRRVHSYHGHGHNHYGPGLHLGGRRFHVGFHF